MKPDQTQVIHGDEVRIVDEMNLERDQQKTREGYDEADDDMQIDGGLWHAANFYVNVAIKSPIWGYFNFKKWPWGPEAFKPWKKNGFGNYTTEIDDDRCLIKAGALIMAEQERLERALRKVVDKLAEIRKQKANQ